MNRFAQRQMFDADEDSVFPADGSRPCGSEVRESGRLRKTAMLSGCRRYRYLLGRHGDEGAGAVHFLMLNPSTADHNVDDPTIRRCVGYAKAWGYSDLYVTNLFAFRSTDPKALAGLAPEVRVGAENDRVIVETARACKLTVCAWGSNKTWGRDEEVLDLLERAGVTPHCLHRNEKGRPKHPLYAKADLTPIPMR